MAARPTSKLAPVGSIAWIANERLTIQQLENQDIEDFTFSARNDLEWLNEHMADIFERKTFDMAEILKTPGRLRGKTPRTGRKQIEMVEREPLVDIFLTNKATPNASVPRNQFYDVISQSATKSDQPLPFSQEQSPPKSVRRQHGLKPNNNQELYTAKEPINRATERGLPTAPSFTDSGFFSSSNPNSQVEQSQQTEKPKSPRRQSNSSQIYVDASPGAPERDSDGGRATRQSFRTAKESASDLASSPTRETQSKDEPDEIIEPSKELASPEKSTSPQVIAAEPRRSGRLARQQSTGSEVAQGENDEHIKNKEVTQPASQLKEREAQEDYGPIATNATSYPTLSEVSSQEEVEPELKSPERDSRSETPESPIPDVPLVRKSSLNFASLPAREPLTNKKKSLGAKVVRDSHIDQIRLNGANRASWMNKKGSGKSLGASSSTITTDQSAESMAQESPVTSKKRKSEAGSAQWQKKAKPDNVEIVDVVEEITTVPTKEMDEDSDGETQRSLALHNKSSTQRLHDKIQQLGKLNASRTARSFPAPAPQPTTSYPDLPQTVEGQDTADIDKLADDSQTKASLTQASRGQHDLVSDNSLARPQLTRSQTEETARIRSKFEQLASAQGPSPKRRPPPPKIWSPPPHGKTPSITSPILSPGRNALLESPTRQATPAPQSPLKDVTYPDFFETSKPLASAPASPSKSPAGGAISAAKAQTASMLKKAREMWMKSSVVSASAKAEILSPPLRKRQGVDSLHETSNTEAGPSRPQAAGEQEESLYPDLRSALASREETEGGSKELRDVAPRTTSPEVVKPTRNSRPREDGAIQAAQPVQEPAHQPAESTRQGRQTRLSKSRESVPEDSAPVPPKSPTKSQEKDEELQRAREVHRRQQEEILRKEKEELRQKQQEEIEKEEYERQAQKAREAAAIEIENEERESDERDRGRIDSSAEPERPPSRLQKGHRLQKPSETKKPVRPIKEPPKAKPAPVSIKIGTASQREMQDQRNKLHAGPTGSTLISALKSSFEPPRPTLPTSNSQTSLHSSSSASSIRSTSTAGPSRPLKSLTAAANQLKKEQEEKERKAAQKREIERRRLENQKRQEREDEQKRQQMQKGRTTPGPSTTKPISRVNAVANLRQKSEEPADKRPDYQSASIYNKDPVSSKGPVKRALPQDTTEEQSIRQPVRIGAQYQQDSLKKRRTNEVEERGPYEMAPPVRNSVVKKDFVSKSALPHGYAQAPPQAPSASMMKPLAKPGVVLPQVEGVKFSKDKIRFANEATPGPSTFKTPASKMKSKTPATLKDSPLYPNAEAIELPDIPTDSEDEDDYPQDFKVPQWAESPELRAILRAQQTKNPEEVFGPMAKLDMEEIFAGRSDRAAARFRARTSSANWSGVDRLTQAEIQADQEARRKMEQEGGWSFSAL